MECNKDEAARSKEIAEAKFLQHDYAGARKFALKARQLFPELEGLPQFISVLEIHAIAHEKLPGGERNWYGILQVDPLADESTIRKQYRKLALLLHPDKNKSVGAEAAFKQISEAWGVLSDKSKKAAHDMRRNAKACQSSKVTQFKEPPPPSNGNHNINRPSAAAQPQAQAKPHPAPPPPPPDLRTFWTACPSCRMQFEYQRIYVGKNLCCPVCFKPFLAREVPPVSGATLWPSQQQQGFRMEAGAFDYHANGIKLTSFGNGTFPWSPFGKTAAARVVNPQVSESVKKDPGTQEQKAKNGNADFQDPGKQEQKAKNENADFQAWKDPEKQEQKAKNENADFHPWKDPGKQEQKAKNENADYQAWKDWAKKQQKQQGNGDFQVWKDLGKKEQKQKGLKKKERDENKAKAAAQAKEAFDRLIARSKGVIQQKLSSDKAAALGGKVAADNTPINNGYGEGKENRVAQDKDDTGGISSVATCRSVLGKTATPARFDNEAQEDISPAKKPRSYSHVSLDEHVLKGGLCNKIDSFISKTMNIHGTEIPKPPVDLGNANDNAVKGNSSLPVTSQTSISDLSKDEKMFDTMHIDDVMNVPDADFYDFDKDRTENHFSIGQIWAAYDDDDGMPRFYARINKVISRQPFKVQMSWLEARSPSDETMAWLDSGFAYTCGEYKLGNTTVSDCINTFSHLVTSEKGSRGGCRIYPRKGDVWALYKDWNTLKKKDERHGYDMIEVLTDFKDELGVQVCFLFKIKGFKTLFQRQLGPQYVQWISPKELPKFSHQVPAHRLTVEQAPGSQEGCWELDPASTPLDLITGRQV